MPKIIYNSIDKLMSGLKKDFLNGDVGKSIQKQGISELREKLYREVYSKPPSPRYERTWELFDSIVSDKAQTGNKIMFDVYNDWREMSSPHASWEDGSDQRKNIVNWINYGHDGGYNIHYKPTNYIEKAQEKFNKTCVSVIRNSLARKGIKTTLK